MEDVRGHIGSQGVGRHSGGRELETGEWAV